MSRIDDRLRAIMVLTFVVPLMLSANHLLGQNTVQGRSPVFTVAVSGAALRAWVRDEAYSSSVYGGWMPSAAVSANMLSGRHVHGLKAGVARGYIAHPGEKAGTMSLSQWKASYRWLYLPGEKDRQSRVEVGVGAGLQYHTLSRSYQDLINAGVTRDQWGLVSLRGLIGLCLNEEGSILMRLEAGLGFLGLFDIGPKLPESNAGNVSDAGSNVTWMPGKSAFSGDMGMHFQYRHRGRHVFALGCQVESARNENLRPWGVKQLEVLVSYGIVL